MKHVCRYCGQSFDPGSPEDEKRATKALRHHEAACRVEAAAPDLLAACERADEALSLVQRLMLMEHEHPGNLAELLSDADEIGTIDGTLTQLRAAITRAKGKE